MKKNILRNLPVGIVCHIIVVIVVIAMVVIGILKFASI